MEELPTFIKVLGVVAVVGGALLSILIFLCKLWFVQMGARALVKYVGKPAKNVPASAPVYRTYGTPVSEWKGRIPDPPTRPVSPPRGRSGLRVIKGGLE